MGRSRLKSSNPYRRIDVPLLLERLKIQARPRGGGRRLIAPCPDPAHDDRNPSWFIRDIPGEPYHAAHVCRGCGFKGGPTALVMTVLGLDTDDAREWLKDLTLPRPLPTSIEIEVKELAPSRFVLPRCFRFAPFDLWPERHRDYLVSQEKPRLEPWQVERWGLGYVDARCSCYQKRHAQRIAVPVRNEFGELCSYTSRAIGAARLRYVEPKRNENPRPARPPDSSESFSISRPVRRHRARTAPGSDLSSERTVIVTSFSATYIPPPSGSSGRPSASIWTRRNSSASSS